MAWHFDETNDDVQLTDNSALNFPDADWTIAGRVKLDDNIGSLYQYFFSWGAFGASPSINLFFTEASGPNANDLNVNINGTLIESTTSPGTSTLWQHVIVERASGTTTLYVDNSSVVSTGTALGAVNVAGNLFFGSRSDSNADRYLGGDMAEWAKWDRALNSDERQALVDGFAPSFFPNSLTWYVPMIRPYRERIVPLTVSNTGSIAIAHPPVIYPVSPQIITAPAAAVPAGIEVFRRRIEGC